MEKIVISKRHKLKLTDAEMAQLKSFLMQYGAYSTLKKNTKISYDTIQRLFEKGSAERDTIINLRGFLRKMVKAGMINEVVEYGS